MKIWQIVLIVLGVIAILVLVWPGGVLTGWGLDWANKTPDGPVQVAPPPTTEEPAEPAATDDAPTQDSPEASNCVTADWFSEQVGNTDTVSELLGAVDREFNRTNGRIGQGWTQEQAESTTGFTVPANSVFWTDIFEFVRELPEGVEAVRTQGGWGVYKTSVEYRIPVSAERGITNGGGRYANLCSGTEISDMPAQSTCLSEADMNNIAGSSDPVKAFNSFYESVGYAFGMEIAEGGIVPAGYYFLGTFPADEIPLTSVTPVGASGFLWYTNQEIVAPHGGRAVKSCAE